MVRYFGHEQELVLVASSRKDVDLRGKVGGRVHLLVHIQRRYLMIRHGRGWGGGEVIGKPHTHKRRKSEPENIEGSCQCMCHTRPWTSVIHLDHQSRRTGLVSPSQWQFRCPGGGHDHGKNPYRLIHLTRRQHFGRSNVCVFQELHGHKFIVVRCLRITQNIP